MGDIVAMGDIGDANVGMQTLMLWLSLQPSHGMDIVAMGDTGDANVVMLTLMLLLNLGLSHTTSHTKHCCSSSSESDILVYWLGFLVREKADLLTIYRLLRLATLTPWLLFEIIIQSPCTLR